MASTSASKFHQYFSDNYTEARARFIESLQKQGAQHHSYPVGSAGGESLTIDVGIIGPESAPCVLTSCGVHGIEGYFGSAVQLAMLDNQVEVLRENIKYVFVHAVNPFGMSQLRRFTENNVDLNRNFLAPGQFNGVAPAYKSLHGLLNPESPPHRFEPFKLKALSAIVRYGLPALKEAVACGQYEYPKGIFYGGDSPCESTRVVMQHCKQWCERSDNIVHLDWHTGLGDFAKYKLLIDEPVDSDQYRWFNQTFESECIEAKDVKDGTAYPVHGLFGRWVNAHLNDRRYLYCTAEFGTFDPIRVLAAIRAENRAHHYGDDMQRLTAKAELIECFSPASIQWREEVVGSAVELLIKRASDGIQTIKG